MTLKEFKDSLVNGAHSTFVGGENTNPNLLFKLEDGTIIPPYFHITEMGLKTKHFRYRPNKRTNFYIKIKKNKLSCSR